MKAIICKILSILITCGGVAVSIIEKNPLTFVGFLFGGFISYELAVLIERGKKQ